MPTLQFASTLPAFEYTPEEYSADETLHFCIPGVNPDKRSFTTEESYSGDIHRIKFEYQAEPTRPFEEYERYSSVTAARASRRIKKGHASDCPFCSDTTEFTHTESRLPANQSYPERKRWQAEVLADFKQTVITSCRPERHPTDTRTLPADIHFAELTTNQYDTPQMEILTNTRSFRYAYPRVSLPNWYTLGYAIAQNPWLEVKNLTSFETAHTRIHITAEYPSAEAYGDSYYRFLSQRDTVPYETYTPESKPEKTL